MKASFLVAYIVIEAVLYTEAQFNPRPFTPDFSIAGPQRQPFPYNSFQSNNNYRQPTFATSNNNNRFSMGVRNAPPTFNVNAAVPIGRSRNNKVQTDWISSGSIGAGPHNFGRDPAVNTGVRFTF